MRELSLFTGMGGGIYGSLILGWQTVAYVERDAYCQKIIKQRIADGWFDAGEIYGDIKEFNQNHAQKYSGKIDVLTGGFPCQPFSVAGKRKGTSDERYLFDEIIKTIKIVQPRQMLFENVPGLLDSPAIIEIYESLTKAGYIVHPPLVLGSDDCGNIHRRKRVWIFAHAKGERPRGRSRQGRDDEWFICEPNQQKGREVWGETPRCTIRDADATGGRCQRGQCPIADTKCGGRTKILCSKTKCCKKSVSIDETASCDTHIGLQPPHANRKRRERQWTKKVQGLPILQRRENIRSLEDIIQRPDIPQPLLFRMDDELSDWKQQLKAIGNGQDPIVMATAYLLLSDTI